MSELVESALRLLLHSHRKQQKLVPLPTCHSAVQSSILPMPCIRPRKVASASTAIRIFINSRFWKPLIRFRS
jgi:hypothetical protein